MILVIPAALLTAATLVLAVLYRLVLLLLRRPAPGFWGRTLRWHVGLLLFHSFVTLPVAFGAALPHMVGTRPDERDYRGPRIDADGTWQVQTRDSLLDEREASGAAGQDASASPDEPDSPYAVSLVASDGVRLRGFLVPPAEVPDGGPRFEALLVHGLFRGALELEPVARMLRDLGGEVLLLELRNHGGSGRAPFTLDVGEALDVRAAAEFLKRRPGDATARRLILFADSLGTGAAARAAPGLETLAGLVLDAPFGDKPSAARRYFGGGSLLLSVREPWISVALFSARVLGGVPLGREQPREALSLLPPGVAVLFVGGGRDPYMPPETVRALFEALPTPPERKRLWIDPESAHAKAWINSPDEYRRQLAWLCDTAVGPAAAAAEREAATPE